MSKTSMKKVWVIPLVLIVLASCSYRGKRDRTEDDMALLMQRSGMNAQLAQTPRVMQAALARERSEEPEVRQLPQANYEELVRMLAVSFAPVVLRESVRQRLAARLSPDEVKAALAWLGSPLGRKITELEEEASRPETFEARQRILAISSSDAERILHIRKLEAAVRGTDSALNAAVAAQSAIITALTRDLPREKRPSVEEVRELLTKLTPEWRQTAERQTVLYFLDTYRTLSNDDLDLYIRFAESPEGRKYHEVLLDAVAFATNRATSDMASRYEQDNR